MICERWKMRFVLLAQLTALKDLPGFCTQRIYTEGHWQTSWVEEKTELKIQKDQDDLESKEKVPVKQ